MNVIILLIMCIARMIYLAVPTLLCAIGIQAIVYRVSKISLINSFVEVLKRGI